MFREGDLFTEQAVVPNRQNGNKEALEFDIGDIIRVQASYVNRNTFKWKGIVHLCNLPIQNKPNPMHIFTSSKAGQVILLEGRRPRPR